VQPVTVRCLWITVAVSSTKVLVNSVSPTHRL
jgi:hypothetical protein